MAMMAATALLLGACGRDDSLQRSATGPSSTTQATTNDGGTLHLDAKLISSLESFDACDDLLAYLRTEGAKVVGPYGFGGGGWAAYATGGVAVPMAAARDATAGASAPGPAPAPGATDEASAPVTTVPDAADVSSTNVQEAGVDEPDLVKTDGRRLVTTAGGQLRVVDLTAAQPKLAGSLQVGNSYPGGDLFLAGDRVLVVRPLVANVIYDAPPPVAVDSGRGVSDQASARPIGGGIVEPKTAVTVVDIADPSAPKVVSELTIDGSLVASRMVDGVARLVLRTGPPNLPFLFPSGSEESVAVATEANRKAVAGSTLDDWLPGFTQDGDAERRLTDCRDVRRPEVFSGVGMLSVVTVDAEDPRPGPGATVVGAGETVYASAQHLFVTSTAWQQPDPAGAATTVPPKPATTSTDIHAFDIHDKVRTGYLGSGRVSGRLLSSFSMSELDGALRVATTDDATMESAVTVLEVTDGPLTELGRVGGLGKGERIYAVRFLADRGYVVTFRQTDPLYVLDLADPKAPVVRGELKLNGYSAYLHPVGEHRLLGIGQDATDQGRVQGTQLSLFDVSDPANPKRLANAVVTQSRSEAEFDHHAFLWWPKAGLTVVPVQSYQDGSTSAIGFHVGDAEVSEVGRVQHPDRSQIRRTIVLGDRLLTISDTGLATSDLANLHAEAWLGF
jgi:uncharacterized secreted protein with C-terminal beta-propeller domain